MKAMNAAGLKQMMFEAVMQGDKDFSAFISKMKDANIDVRPRRDCSSGRRATRV
jgi:hypothetical protein